MKSKTIILSSQTSEKGRGILTIYEENSLLHCKLRLYNITEINRYCKLGVYHNKEVFSGNLLEKGGVFTSSLVGDFNMDNDFYTAIIDTSQNNKVILSGGTYSGYFLNNDSVFKSQEDHLFDTVEKENPTTNLFDYSRYESPIKAANNSLKANKIEYPNDWHNDNMIEQNKPCHCEESEENLNKCETCEYKKFFYSHQENINVEKAIIEEEKPVKNEQTKPSILASIIPQFDYVFENYPMDETLNALIPNSKFVKINENREQYSIGAIYKDEEMKYICYAVFKTYNTPAPEEIGEHYQWLPIDKEDPLSDGYYIVFQDTSDLKIVEL